MVGSSRGPRRVVITGLGAISPLGLTTKETWEGALAGRSGGGRISRFDPAAFTTQVAAEVKGFDPLTYIEPKEVKKLDLFCQYALGAAQQAWDDSNLATYTGDKNRMGCILGVGIGGLSTLEKYHEAYLEGGPRKISPFLIPAMISNLGPGHVAIRFGLRGVNYVVTSACTSSNHALGEAFRMVRDGLQDVVFTGGAEAAITPIGVGGFCSCRAMTTRNDEPTKASRPFDRDRDGFLLGEGAALLVLESLESAQARGAKIYAEVAGYGFSCDAFHITSQPEDGSGAVSSMKMALDFAGLRPDEVDYVNAHGTSTPVNDPTETLAIKTVFGERAKNGLLVSSTKSMTGHLLGAAGGLEAVFTALAIQQGIVPPTINLENPAEGCDLDYVPHVARKANIRAAISNSFGFGGTNATVVIKAFSN